MRTQASPTAAKQRYTQTHAAHAAAGDLLGAQHGDGEVIASHSDSPEAGCSRTQILAIVNRVVPGEELLACHTALILRHPQPEGDRSTDPGQAMKQGKP
jgi:hypothetical protein